MGRKNVPKDTGVHTASKQGIPAGLFDCSRNKDAGFTENSPVFRRTLPDRQHGFSPWTWKTENPKPKVSGIVPSFFGTSDCL